MNRHCPRCPLCGWEYSDEVNTSVEALQHFVKEHHNTERMRNALDEIRVRATCGVCDGDFTTDLNVGPGGLNVDAFCPECCEKHVVLNLACTSISAKEAIAREVKA